MKVWTIALKDTRTRFRDRGALILMLVAPLILMLIVAAAFGHRADHKEVDEENLTVIVVNENPGKSVQRFTDQLRKRVPDGMPEPIHLEDLRKARRLLDQGQALAVIYIPDHSTEALHRSAGALIFNRPVSGLKAKRVKQLVKQTVTEMNSAIVSANLTTLIGYKQAMSYADLPGFNQTAYLSALQDKVSSTFFTPSQPPITLQRMPTVTESDPRQSDRPHDTQSMLDQLAYLAVGLMIFFLFFSMFDNVISLLTEFKQGTYNRLLVAGTSIGRILLGKISGAFFIGFLQVSCLIIASRLLLGLDWGQSTAGLLLISVATVAAITSLGTLLSAFVSNTNEANILAGTIILVFAALGGNFYQPYDFPSWLQYLSYMTINRWAIDGYVDIAIHHRGIEAVLFEASVLAGIALLFFTLGVWKFSRRFAKQ